MRRRWFLMFLNWLSAKFQKRPVVTFVPEPEKAEPLSWHELRRRWRPVQNWCANHAGVGFRRPARAAAPGWFWKRDLEGKLWRLYREPC